MEASVLWNKICRLCKMSDNISDVEYSLYFSGIEAKEYDNDTLILECGSILIKEKIE